MNTVSEVVRGMDGKRVRRLYYGDNLPVLREMPDELVDLIYLDPPFNSNRAYNVIYPDDLGQTQAFSDTWAWTPQCDETLTGSGKGMKRLAALVDGMGKTQMAAYLVMMTPRLAELHRILKPTGSLYLHCDSTASHYLKIILDDDELFGSRNFRSEIVWRRINSTGRGKRRLANNTDYILYYVKSDGFTWHQQYKPHDPSYISDFYRFTDDDGRLYRLDNLKGAGVVSEGSSGMPWRGIDPTDTGSHWAIPGSMLPDHGKGLSTQDKLDLLESMGRIYWPPKGKIPSYKRYLDEMPGTPLDNIWDDIKNIQSHAKERMGYQTQKPIRLLTRIVSQSSNPGDLILDPFAGCGSSIAAAENLRRGWIGIDITYSAIAAIQERFKRDRVDIWKNVEILNRPETLQDVEERLLNTQNPLHPRKEFEKFCVASIGGLPNEKMGADGGVDGRIQLLLNKRANVSVKSGGVGVRDVRDLGGTLNDKNIGGVFVTRQQPTGPMRSYANKSGVVQLELMPPFPRLQILTLDEILNGKRPDLPYAHAA